jgi:tellurite resistance protein
MKNIADITDNAGSWLRIDLVPGTDLDDPELIMVTIKDDALAAVTLTTAQAVALADGLKDALWEARY